MKRTHITIIAVAILSLVPAINILADQRTQSFTETQAIQLATEGIMETPTYQYDGIPGTLEQTNATKNIDTWTITFTYTSRHSGYGYREGQTLLQALTPHTTVIQIRDREIISIITDNTYDEQTEQFTNLDTDIVQIETQAIEYLKNAPTFSYDGVPESLETQDQTEQH